MLLKLQILIYVRISVKRLFPLLMAQVGEVQNPFRFPQKVFQNPVSELHTSVYNSAIEINNTDTNGVL